jgi:hypothetical protein
MIPLPINDLRMMNRLLTNCFVVFFLLIIFSFSY